MARSPWPAVMVLCAGILMDLIDGTVVTVALPAIQADLGMSTAGLSWVVDAFSISYAGLLLLAGRLGDLYGRKAMFVWGLAVFTVASALCGLSTSAALLVGARFLQGIGAAMSSAVALGMIVMLFEDETGRAKAISVFSFIGAAGASIGVLVGGIVTQMVSWHWIFLVNIPIGVVACGLAIRLLPPDPTRAEDRQVDYVGAGWTVAMMLMIWAVVGTATAGWVSVRTVVMLGLSAVSFVVLAWWLRRSSHPLLPLRVFRSPNVVAGNTAQALTIGAIAAAQFAFALYLRQVRGYDALWTGIAFLPATVAIGVCSLSVAGRLIGRVGRRPVLLVSLVVMTASLAAFAVLMRLPGDAHYVLIVVSVLVVFGCSIGLGMPAVIATAMADATEADSGLVSGLTNATGQIGGALGIAVLASLAAAHIDPAVAAGIGDLAAKAGGYRVTFAGGAVLTTVAFIVTAAVLRPAGRTEAAQPATEPAT